MPAPRLPQLALLLTALCAAVACRTQPKAGPTTRLATPATAPATRPAAPADRHPILDLRRGTGSFPLGTRPIDSTDSLAAALREGYLARLVPVDPGSFLTLRGAMPALDLLRVDVSDARVRPEYRPTEFARGTQVDGTVTVRCLEYVANPLRDGAASPRATLVADDARLDLLRDSKGARGLVLAGARSGRMEFRASTADLNHLFAVAPRRAGDSGSNLTVVRAAVSFASDDPHSLAATLELRARWLLLPITLTFRGRLAAAPDGTVTFSGLDVTGHDPGGLLAAAVLDPALRKLNGTTRPILSFADPATRVTAVRFATEDGLSLTVDFGR